MSKVYHKLFYHVIWSTYRREPIITENIEKELYQYMTVKASQYNAILLGIGGVEDHIHIAISIPPSESVGEIIGKLKGSSSYHLNHDTGITENFSWQSGYGVLSFAEKDLSSILNYIHFQKEHHREKRTNLAMETIEDVE